MKSKIYITISLLMAVLLPVFIVNAGEKPSVRTESAMDEESYSAVLRASVDPNGYSTVVFFEFGSYADRLNETTPSQAVGDGTSRINVMSSRSGLSPNTRYYYRAVAVNLNGVSYGSTKSFETDDGSSTSSSSTSSCRPPLARTNLPKHVTENSATFLGSVNAEDNSTIAWFEYGESFSLGNKTQNRYVSRNSFALDVEESLTGLKPGTLYYYRVVAENDCRSSVGNILVFSTSGSANTTTNTNNTNNSQNNNYSNSTTNDQDISLWQEIKNTSLSNGEDSIAIAYSDDVIEFRLFIKNESSEDIKNVVIKNKLSDLFSFVESSPDISVSSSGNSLVWSVGSIKKDEIKTILLKAKVKQTDKNIIAYNLFTSGEKRSNKTSLIINPVTAIGGVGVNANSSSCDWEGCSSASFSSSLPASIGTSFRNEWGWMFNILLFIFVFSFFSILFVYYKLSWK